MGKGGVLAQDPSRGILRPKPRDLDSGPAIEGWQTRAGVLEFAPGWGDLLMAGLGRSRCGLLHHAGF